VIRATPNTCAQASKKQHIASCSFVRLMNLNLYLLIHSSTAVLRNNNCVSRQSGGFFGLLLVAAVEGGAPAHHLTVGYALGAR
jgi:hypothetical protein